MPKINHFFFYDFNTENEISIIAQISKFKELKTISGVEMFHIFRIYNNLLFDEHIPTEVLSIQKDLKKIYFAIIKLLAKCFDKNISKASTILSLEEKYIFIENTSGLYGPAKIYQENLFSNFNLEKFKIVDEVPTTKYFPFQLFLLLDFSFFNPNHLKEVKAHSDILVKILSAKRKRIQSIFDYNALIFQEMTEKTNESFDENLILETNFLKHIYSNNNFNYSQKKSTIKKELFQERLKNLRLNKNLSQEALANLLDKTKRTIIDYENSPDLSSIKTIDLENLSLILGASPDYIAGNVENPYQIINNGTVLTKPIRYFSDEEILTKKLIDKINNSTILTKEHLTSLINYIDNIK